MALRSMEERLNWLKINQDDEEGMYCLRPVNRSCSGDLAHTMLYGFFTYNKSLPDF